MNRGNGDECDEYFLGVPYVQTNPYIVIYRLTMNAISWLLPEAPKP
jgi:hypothetical protein